MSALFGVIEACCHSPLQVYQCDVTRTLRRTELAARVRLLKLLQKGNQPLQENVRTDNCVEFSMGLALYDSAVLRSWES